MTITSSYNGIDGDTMVYSTYDNDLEPVELHRCTFEEYFKMQKRIREFEQAAYRRGVADVVANVDQFRGKS